ncbi:hypothetical protein JOQ06_022641 [Pogonophryne albipinna]|uniref:Non-homologous end-joining factor 1 n=1 Tax=Pogonophryne albipinna TaxID=1090488 RepID=A0AAD6A5H4_9TELE|nr:hypothetical protein JOQ06_022641 [Pogonophryne albipinna]
MEVLLQRPWLPVSINGVQLLSKSCFGETEYHILLTDMKCVWEERMESADIETRAQELNRRLRAPVKAFFSHLSEVVRPALTGSGGGINISVTQEDGNINMKLKSELAGLPFYWEFHCTPAPVTVLVRPLLAMSFLMQRQVEQLGGLLGRKDAEIQDYRENGATLSRERLQTEVFEERTYRENFMSKNPHHNSTGQRLSHQIRFQVIGVMIVKALLVYNSSSDRVKEQSETSSFYLTDLRNAGSGCGIRDVTLGIFTGSRNNGNNHERHESLQQILLLLFCPLHTVSTGLPSSVIIPLWPTQLPVRVPARTSGVRQPTENIMRRLVALPLLVSDQSDSLQFDAGLQQLYAAVVSHGNSRKRKLSEEPSVEETPADEPLGGSKVDSGAAEEVQLEAAGAKMADRATERKSLPSAPAERPSAKPKKKKVGLFR